MLSAPGPIDEVATMIWRRFAALANPAAASAHALLVLTAPRRQRVAGLLQRQTETGDVAVAEDRIHAGEQRHLDIVDDGSLGDQIPNDRRRGGEFRGAHVHSSPQ